MYVVVRKDLQLGSQAVQASHVLVEFCYEHPIIAEEWHKKSKYLVYLSARDEKHLEDLIFKCKLKEIKYSIFKEPDIGNSITAIAFEPSHQSSKLLSNLPLLLSEYK